MIENVLKMCHSRMDHMSYRGRAIVAAIEALAEHWVEDSPVQLKGQIGCDIDLVVKWMQVLLPEIETMLELHEQLKPQSLTFHVVARPSIFAKGENELEGDNDTSAVERWDRCLRRVRNMLAREEAIADVWNVNDVLDAAERMDVALNREDAQKALQYTEEHFRAQDGINWTVIEEAIGKVLEGDDDEESDQN